MACRLHIAVEDRRQDRFPDTSSDRALSRTAAGEVVEAVGRMDLAQRMAMEWLKKSSL